MHIHRSPIPQHSTREPLTLRSSEGFLQAQPYPERLEPARRDGGGDWRLSLWQQPSPRPSRKTHWTKANPKTKEQQLMEQPEQTPGLRVKGGSSDLIPLPPQTIWVTFLSLVPHLYSNEGNVLPLHPRSQHTVSELLSHLPLDFRHNASLSLQHWKSRGKAWGWGQEPAFFPVTLPADFPPGRERKEQPTGRPPAHSLLGPPCLT